jgi:hypothetical protein
LLVVDLAEGMPAEFGMERDGKSRRKNGGTGEEGNRGIGKG